jgi:hypothetical protein
VAVVIKELSFFASKQHKFGSVVSVIEASG